MKKTVLFHLPVIALGALGLVACATLRPAEGVRLSLVNVQLTDATLWETIAQFTVRVQNETPDAVTLTGGVHKFYLDGLLIGDGLTGETVTLPRLSSTTQVVPVHLRNLALARRVKPLLEQQRFSYRVESVLYVAKNTGERRARLVGAGELDLREFQPAPQSAPGPNAARP